MFLVSLLVVINGMLFSQEMKTVKKSELKNPFYKLSYTKVVAYNFALKGSYGERGSILTENGNLDRSAVLPGRNLSKEETAILILALTDTSTYGGTSAACFEPRLAFVFYKESKIVGCVNVCFECNYLHSAPEIPAQNYYNHKIGDYVVPSYGFSKQGRKRLVKLCKTLNMPYCVQSEQSMFDE
jgi:hypothetical protein